MIGNYIYGAQAVLLVYDISNYQSFANLEDWFALVKRTFDSDYMPYVALVANKADLTNLQTVKPKLHSEFADSNQMHSFFVSAKTGDNVAEAFYRIVADLAGVVSEMRPPDFYASHKRPRDGYHECEIGDNTERAWDKQWFWRIPDKLTAMGSNFSTGSTLVAPPQTDNFGRDVVSKTVDVCVTKRSKCVIQ
eukprot:9471942-Pyramimonas_sp.AAC.1